jgi:hypothetical protein
MVIDIYTHDIGLNEPLVKQTHITHLFFFFKMREPYWSSLILSFKNMCVMGMEFDLILNNIGLKFLVRMIKVEMF